MTIEFDSTTCSPARACTIPRLPPARATAPRRLARAAAYHVARSREKVGVRRRGAGVASVLLSRVRRQPLRHLRELPNELLVVGDLRQVACERVTASCRGTTTRVNVASPSLVQRHACVSMPHFPVEWGDICGRECRSMRHGSYQCPVAHVAPDGWVGRHALLHMSLGKTGWSDIVVDACRPEHLSEATHSRGNVALHELVERHAGFGMSHLARIRSDMLALACRTAHA